ncbi:ATP-dependent RNA helicase DEAH13-like [Telopea speciosissima]|uniref:ATP-dependent RNA helicase DEAH13-like n=1 Tax=Telopea speciosissima TaxID=54955 RepID=UPI001CC80476|nr:ATP-dependent RNA helicase DEAH13-like [Telopea speciosissima]
MRSCHNNLEQSLDVDQIFFQHKEAFQDSWSSKGDDSNAIILLEKNKKKTNGTSQLNSDVKKKVTMSKSQKRKLKKLEEEKEKAALLASSMRILEKYKIREDAYSLLQSSGNIGQVETMKEKRRRAVEFSKAGLEVAQDERPSKKRSDESKSDFDEGHQNQELNKDDLQCPVMPDREGLKNIHRSLDACQDPTCGSPLGSEFLSDTAIPAKGFADEDDGRDIQHEGKNSLLPPCNRDEIKSTNLLDGERNGPKPDSHGSSVLVDSATQRPISTPTVVHVSRPNEVESKRKDLPIVMMEQEIMEAINENSALIICGETGCGKTTQVPQFLYEAGFGLNKSGSKSSIIGVTQPRRVAVLATAKRVAFELGLRLGKEVGFQVRHDKKIGDHCSIKFMTDGILLREVQSDFLLRKYSVIVLDEAHERSLNTDILIGMLSRIIQIRQRLYEEQQEKVLSGVKISPENLVSQLKLVLMSATLRVEDFVSERRLFNENPPVIEVPTRQFPVTVHFSKRTEIVDYMGQAYKKVLSIHKRLPPGGILVFVTGQREVEYLCRKLRKTSRELTQKFSKQKESEATAVLDVDTSDQGIDMKDINEAFEVHGSSDHQKTDRFSSCDEDHDVLDEEEFDSSDDLGTDSELEVDGDVEGSLKYENHEKNGKHFDVLGEPGSLASLKAAFAALASNNAPDPTSEGKLDSPITPGSEGCLNQSTSTSTKKCDMADGPCASAMCVLPLYAMLPAAVQLRVFEKVPEGERLVVVATNVAETSLTIPGIKYVVDTGREKVKNYNSSNGMETYEIHWISKASAAQRAGRAGRTGPGHCYRLYSSAVFTNIFSDFSIPEISKIPVDGVVLLMKSMGIDKVANFPFPTPPEATALVEAERCLMALEALDSQGRLTPLGRAMAKYPMSPRHSRMLLTVIQIMKKVQSYPRANLVFAYTVAAAAALSLSNPFIMQFEGSHNNSADLDRDDKTDTVDTPKILDKEEKLRQKKLKEITKLARAKFCNPSSDALTIAYALQSFEHAGNPTEFCKDNSLHLKTMEEMSKLRKQLLQLVFHQSSVVVHEDFLWTYGTVDDVEQAWRISSNRHPLLLNEEELLGQAICAGWADRIAKRIRLVSVSSDRDRKANAPRYQSCMVKETVFLHRWSSVSRTAPEFLVYSELLNTKRPYMHGVTSVKPDWLVKYAASLCSFSTPLSDPKPFYEPSGDQVFCWVSPTFGPHLWQLPLHSLPVSNGVHRVTVFAYALLEGQVLPCLRSAQKFMAAPAVTILRPEAAGQRRVGNLINELMAGARSIDSRAMLRKIWNENPQKLHSEIRDWFQEKFHDQFEKLWAQMHREVLLECQELFPKSVKKEKRKSRD